jgi:hypothetical protein
MRGLHMFSAHESCCMCDVLRLDFAASAVFEMISYGDVSQGGACVVRLKTKTLARRGESL